MSEIIPTIRQAMEIDIDIITEMCLSLKEALDLEAGSTTSLNKREETRSNIMKCLTDNTKILFVALIDEEIAGFIEGEIRPPHPVFKPETHGHIVCLFIKKIYRDFGISRLLTFKIEDWFRSHNINAVEINVRAKNLAGKNLWNSLGFYEISTILKKDL